MPLSFPFRDELAPCLARTRGRKNEVDNKCPQIAIQLTKTFHARRQLAEVSGNEIGSWPSTVKLRQMVVYTTVVIHTVWAHWKAVSI